MIGPNLPNFEFILGLHCVTGVEVEGTLDDIVSP